jgi:nicotinamide-nucleotide amidase
VNDAGAATWPQAAIVAVGTELVTGIRDDTNGAEVARALTSAGYLVSAREIMPDDASALARRLRDLIAEHELVVVTGGLGPTHDDVTREAAAGALDVALAADPAIEERLRPVLARHALAEAAPQVMRQADVLEGARVLIPGTGTAPGQLVPTDRGHLLLLPGPPHELRPMLAEALATLGTGRRSEPIVLGCVGIPETDAQIVAHRVLSAHHGIGLTVLARPALVEVVLIDEGAGAADLSRAADEVAAALGEACYSTDGTSLAQVVVERASTQGLTIALAESCTGGLIAAALTGIPGASTVLLGSVVTYSDDLKRGLLGVGEPTLREHGAVSAETACEMASGARRVTGADLALSVTGIAGPGGGSADKPVGTVWFSVATAGGVRSEARHFAGDRQVVRARATAIGLDLLRRALSRPGTGPV